MKHVLYFALLIIGYTSCTQKKEVKVSSARMLDADESMQVLNLLTMLNFPIEGYRFTITGDFNGDHLCDTFIEHYYSQRDQCETNKFSSDARDMFDLDRISNQKEVISFFKCNNNELDTLWAGGVIGPLFIKNEGDLDGDGADEIGYVPSLPQASSMNHYYILSFKKHKWEELYSFSVREWQLPPLPYAGISYGDFGNSGWYYVAEQTDSINKVLEHNLKTFGDLLVRQKNGKIKVVTFTEEAEDITMVVDMKKRYP